VPDFDVVGRWAADKKLATDDPAALIGEAAVRQLFADEVEDANRHLAKYERVRAWDLLPQEMTQETGELTPTQKVKRRVVQEKYGAQIDTMYREAESRQPRTADDAA